MQKYKKRPDGRYCKQIVIGYQPNGKRKVKTIYGKTIKEVEKKEREIRESLKQGLVLSGDTLTLGEWGRKWLDVYKCNVSRGTYAMYEKSLRNYIIPNLGDIPMTKLKPVQIQSAINEILSQGLIRTGEIFKLTIKQIISQAVCEGYLNKNICDNLEKIKSGTKEKRVLTDFEIRCVFETKTYTPKERLFLKLLYYTGVRRGEALALTIGDIDLKQKRIKISKSLDINENKPEVKEPKTRAGFRELPIPDELYKELKKYLKDCNSIYLFPGCDGGLSTRSSFRRMWESILKKTYQTADRIREKELEREKLGSLCVAEQNLSIAFTPHTFRHTYATNLYYAGIDIKKSQYYLGHSSLEMTLEIYTHLDNQRNDTECVNKLNEFFRQSKVSQTAKGGA